MKNALITLRLPALIGLLLVIPFMIMEIVNKQKMTADLPIPLFVILWLLPVSFFLLLLPLMRTVRAGNSLLANPGELVVRVVFIGLITFLWIGILADQMPCFLGIPNCD